MRSYTELDGLDEIVLEESYVLGITAEPGRVTFEVDFVLTPHHPEWVAPPPSEVECFRRGTLQLMGVRRLRWDDQGGPPATDATGERDFGHIDSFKWEHDRFLLEGDWGSLDVRAAGAEASLGPA